MDVAKVMRRAAQFYANYDAVVWGERRLTFTQAWDRSVRFANALIDLGIKPGDRVGVLEDNSVPAADFFAGAAIANAVRVPLYPRNGRSAHEHMLSHTGCRVLVVDAKYAEEVEGLLDKLPDLEHVIIRDEGYEDWLMGQSDVDPMLEAAPDDYYIIRHTGGTTGQSKGVAYTHKRWLAAGRDWFYIYPAVQPGDKCLHLGPIAHGSGYLFLPVWMSGGCNVMVDHFHPLETVDIMEKEGIAYLFMVPTMLNAVNQVPGIAERDWSKLKCLLIAAAPITDATALKAYEIFGDAMYQGYGQTEVLPVAFMGPKQWFAKIEGSNPLRACGVTLPFAELEIWDDDNKPLPYGEVGQIVAKCEGQMEGFWENPEGTAERMHEGWVLTGDVGYLDKNGYLYMVDRADDMIISGGFNIWPAELENVIAGHPAVLEVAVFGIPHEKWGATPAAVCVLRDGEDVTEEEIIAICADELGSYKKPSKVVFTKEPLPKSPVGKVLRKDLREPYWAGHESRMI